MKELIDLCDQYLEKTNEFVFQTRLGNFPSILHYYLGSSKLHFSDGTCPIKFSQVRYCSANTLQYSMFNSGVELLGYLHLTPGDVLSEEISGYSGRRN